MKPLVSIIMNCKNGEEFLNQSLNSILNQTYKNWELIFVDNASVDNSKFIFQEFKDDRFKYIYLDKGVNLGSARQIALDNCKGEYIAFLDVDDLWFEEKIEQQLKYFEGKEIGMVISNTIFFTDTKEKIFYSKSPPTGNIFFDLLQNYFISLETLLCKKKYLEEINFKFDNEFSMISDMDLTLRLSMICDLDYCPKILSKWRVHNSSDTWKKKGLFFEEQLNLIEKLSVLPSNKDNVKFSHFKKNFIKKINFSYIINIIEKNEGIKKIYSEISKKNFKFPHLLALYILAITPMSKYILRLYRKTFSINPS